MITWDHKLDSPSRPKRRRSSFIVVHRIGGTDVVGHTPEEIVSFFKTHPEGVATVILPKEKRPDAIKKWKREGVPQIATDQSFVPYHFLVGQDGEVWQCLELDDLGAAQAPVNRFSIGIGVVGDFRKHTPTLTQLGSLDVLCAELLNAFPGSVIHGHDDVRPATWGRKQCPGHNLDLDELRESASEIASARRGEA